MNAERCPGRGPGPPGDLHGSLSVNNAGSNPRSDPRGPPGDLHGTARLVTRCFLLEPLENVHKGKTMSERERERRNKHTSYRRSIWPGPPAPKNAERCLGRGPGPPGDLHGSLSVNNAGSNPRSDPRGPPGDLHGIAHQVTRCFLLEALENAPQGEDNEQGRERETDTQQTHTSYRKSSWPGPCAVNNSGSNPPGNPRRPPGDLHGIALGDLHETLAVHNAGSNPRGDSRGPPGDLHRPLAVHNAGSYPRGDPRGPRAICTDHLPYAMPAASPGQSPGAPGQSARLCPGTLLTFLQSCS